MKVWLLWEDESYAPSTLHGVFATEAAAERARERMRREFRRQNYEWVGADEVFETRRAARDAADARIADDFRIVSERVR